jgi:hypothetical protein
MRTKRVAMVLLLMAPLVLVIAILIDGLTDNVTESDVGIVRWGRTYRYAVGPAMERAVTRDRYRSLTR